MFVKYSVFITCMYLLRDMPIVMCIYLIQIHTFLLFNLLKREVSNVFLYIWTINYSYSYSCSCLLGFLTSSSTTTLCLGKSPLNEIEWPLVPIIQDSIPGDQKLCFLPPFQFCSVSVTVWYCISFKSKIIHKVYV